MGSIPPSTRPNAAAALFGTARQAVLALLYGHPDQRYYVRQILRALNLGHGVVQRELRRLSESGILNRIVEGRQTYYQANPACPVFEELRGLIRKTFGIADVLRGALSELGREIQVAFIYGSVAKGQEGPESDVDVLVVGPALMPSEVYKTVRPVAESLGREMNPKVYQTPEFARKIAAGQHFLHRVLDGPKIFVIGDEDELARLVDEGLAQGARVEPRGDLRALRSR